MIGTAGNKNKTVGGRRSVEPRGLMAALAASLVGRPAKAFTEARRGKSREWSSRLFRIPFEHGGRFKTADGIVYQRHAKTGVITRVIPKVRGKQARADDKIVRAHKRHLAAKQVNA
jgi:hypothetical protein